MAFLDFMSDGSEIPAGSALTAMQRETQIAPWYSEAARKAYAQQLLISEQPYAKLPFNPVAGFTPDQISSFAATRDAAGAYKPGLATANDWLNKAQGTSAVATSDPLYNQALGMDPSKTAATDFTTASNLTNKAAGMSGLAAADPNFNKALALDPSKVAAGDFNSARNLYTGAAAASGVNTASPYYNQAVAGADKAVAGGGGLAAAQPWLKSASGNVADVKAYMDPYQSAVTDEIARLGNRNLMEGIMPGIEDRYIKSGQFSGSGKLTDTVRAMRDTNADIVGKQAEYLSKGYTAAQAAKQSDLDRYGTLASTAGTLGSDQQQAQMDAAKMRESVGTSLADLTGSDADRRAAAGTSLQSLGVANAGLTADQQKMLADIGKARGDLTGADRTGALDAASQAQSLGEARAGLTADQQALIAKIAGEKGTFAGEDATRYADNAEAKAALAAKAQGLGLTGAEALQASGQIQQDQNQSNLDWQKTKFEEERDNPQKQLDKVTETFGNLSKAVGTTTTEQGIQPSGLPAQYGPSTAESIGGAASGLASFFSSDAGKALLKSLKLV